MISSYSRSMRSIFAGQRWSRATMALAASPAPAKVLGSRLGDGSRSRDHGRTARASRPGHGFRPPVSRRTRAHPDRQRSRAGPRTSPRVPRFHWVRESSGTRMLELLRSTRRRRARWSCPRNCTRSATPSRTASSRHASRSRPTPMTSRTTSKSGARARARMRSRTPLGRTTRPTYEQAERFRRGIARRRLRELRDAGLALEYEVLKLEAAQYVADIGRDADHDRRRLVGAPEQRIVADTNQIQGSELDVPRLSWRPPGLNPGGVVRLPASGPTTRGTPSPQRATGIEARAERVDGRRSNFSPSEIARRSHRRARA